MAVMNEEGLKAFTAGEVLDRFRRVKLNASDGKVYMAAADEDELGITDSVAFNAGDNVSVRLRNTDGTRKVVCHSTCSKGAILYGAASGKVDDVNTGGRGRFKALEACLAADTIIEALPIEPGDLRASSAADSTAVSNTTTETTFDNGSKTIPDAELSDGDVLEIVARANMANTHSTDTFDLKLKAGSTVLAATGALDLATGDQAYIHLFLNVRARGASGKLSASGLAKIGGASAVPTVVRLDETAFDTTSDLALTATGTWSVADSTNSAVLEDFFVIHHKQ